MSLSSGSVSIVLFIILFALVILAVWLVLLNASLRKHHLKHREIGNALDKSNLTEALSKALDDIEALRADLSKLESFQQSAQKQLEGAFQR